MEHPSNLGRLCQAGRKMLTHYILTMTTMVSPSLTRCPGPNFRRSSKPPLTIPYQSPMSPRRVLPKARVSLENVGGLDAQDEFSLAPRERNPPYGLRASGSW